MSDVVIKIENVSKQYRLGRVSTKSLAHDINRWWHTSRGKDDPYLKLGEVNDRTKKSTSEYVWSLKDINFDVHQGDVLGVIGKNGAGKSTLLKILSQVTRPTTGKVKIKGRIASLLEVGTGFHPELTGRENIFLNGAILGMSKHEIRSKFDEIVSFSGIERYIDTPVKRYSSGMYVRLAFAVAAHLEPEILIIDEVLAVGDAEFQKKCLGKMKDVAGQGRTVIFVSHNMNAVSRLCSKGVFLKNGTLINQGPIDVIINEYLASDRSKGDVYKSIENDLNKDIALLEAKITDVNGEVLNKPILVDESFNIEFRIKLNKVVKSPHLTFHLQNSKDEYVLFSDRKDDVSSLIPSEMGEYNIKVNFKLPFLKPDEYFLSIGLVNNDTGQTNHFPSILSFEIKDLINQRVDRAGYFFIPFKWNISKLN